MTSYLDQTFPQLSAYKGRVQKFAGILNPANLLLGETQLRAEQQLIKELKAKSSLSKEEEARLKVATSRV